MSSHNYLSPSTKNCKYLFLKICIFLSLLFVMLVLPMSISAEIKLDREYIAKEEKLIIEGTVSKGYATVTVVVVPADVVLNELTAGVANDNRYITKSVNASVDGNYFVSVVMPQWAGNGAYDVYVSDGSEIKSTGFTHFNSARANIALNGKNGINKSISSRDLYNKLDFNNGNLAKELAIEIETFDKYGMEIADGLYTALPSAGYSIEGFIAEMERINAFFKLRESKNIEALEILLEKYSKSFYIDYEEEYKDLIDGVKQVFLAEIQSADLAKYTSMEIVCNGLVFSSVVGNMYPEVVRKAIEKYSSYMKLEMKHYNSLSDYKKTKVILDLLNSNINKYSDIAVHFELLAKTYATEKNSDIGGKGSSSYGGSSTSFKTNIPLVEETEAKPKVIFFDLSNHWAQVVVEKLAEKGIVAGFENNTFLPENNITRAEFAKLIVTALKISDETGSGFADVDVNDWHYSCVYAAESAKLIQGFDGKFRPDDAMTREECAVVIYRALSAKELHLIGTYEFTDFNNISDYAKEAVGALGAEKLISGFDNQFLPLNNISRAEAATMIYNMLSYIEGGK